LKEGVRYIAIASGPISERGKTLVLGMIFRNNYMEGVLSGTIDVDGTDSTKQIIKMIKPSRFSDQIRILLFNGIALAGLNVIDPSMLEKELNAKVVLLNRRKQNPTELINALKEFSRLNGDAVDGRIKIVKAYGRLKPLRINGLYIQSALEKAYIKGFVERAFEALRLAHLVVRGVSTGESKGRL
jgi:endonuclease V-like protein UPF0215 family